MSDSILTMANEDQINLYEKNVFFLFSHVYLLNRLYS